MSKDWLSEIEEYESIFDDHVVHKTHFERMARVLRELAKYILISHRSNDSIEISLVFHNLSDDAKELLK